MQQEVIFSTSSDVYLSYWRRWWQSAGLVFNRRAHTSIDKAAFRHVCCAPLFFPPPLYVVYIIEKRLLVFFLSFFFLWKSTMVVILLRLQRGTRLWVGWGFNFRSIWALGRSSGPGRIFRDDFIKTSRRTGWPVSPFILYTPLKAIVYYKHLFL